MTYTSRKNTAKKSVYSIVTERIVKQMEQGIIPWRKPWDATRPNDSILAQNAITGRVYSFTNQMLLGMRGGLYVGFKQMEEHGGTLKPNAPKYLVTYWTQKEYQHTDSEGNVIIDEDGNEETFVKWSLRYHYVYDIEDIDGLKLPKKRWESRRNTGIDEAENVIGLYVKNNGIGFTNTGSNEAFYSPSKDAITVPNINQFKEVSEYYSTTFHEMTHSTGHEKRLDRLTKSGYGTSNYAKEELVAELGSAFTMAILGIENKATEQNTAAYLQGWIKACTEDETLIVSASTMAEKAVKYIFETAGIENENTKEHEEIPECTTPRRPSAKQKAQRKAEAKKVMKHRAKAVALKHAKKMENLKEQKQEQVTEQVTEPADAPEVPKEEPKIMEEGSKFVEFKVENASFKLNPIGIMKSMALKDFNKMLKYIKAYEETRNHNLNLLINAGQTVKSIFYTKKELETLDKKMKYIMA